MRKLLLFSAGIVLLLASACKHHEKGDAMCRIVEDAGNPRIKEDDFVALTYSIKLDNDSTLYSTYKHQIYRQSADFRDDLFTALGKLGEGDSAVVKVSIDSMIAHGQLTKPNGLSGKYLHYYLRVNKVITRTDSPGHESDSLLNAEIENYKKQSAEADQQKEQAILKHYLADNKLKFDSIASGLYYHIEKQGTGPKPQSGDIAQVVFTGSYTDGEIFFTNDSLAARHKGVYSTERKYDPLDFYMGKQLFIKGFEEGMAMLPGGSVATFVIPSKLSNGERYGFVPLVCHVQLLQVRRPAPGERIKMLHEDEHGEEKMRH